MFSTNTTTTRASRIAIVAVAAASAAMLLASCSSGTPSSTGTKAPTSSSSTSGVAAKVAALQKIGDSYPIPTEKMASLSSVKGETVFYIPITQQAAQFTVTQVALKAALDKVGVKLQVCNGDSKPTTIAACLTQATNSKAAAIVTDSIPYVVAANAFDAAAAAGIPVLNTDQIEDQDHPASKKLGYIYAPASAQLVAVADWIINDSKGKASVVINEATDGHAQVAYVEAAKAEFAKECPDCVVTINEISSANFGLVAPSTSAALLKTPNVGYVLSEFDQFLQPTLGGVQQAGKLASVKGASAAAGLSGLQMLADQNFLYADVGQASAYQGWASADAVLRMMTGTSGADLPEYTVPIRLFTRDNVSDIKLTEDAEASGEWFGPANYTNAFLKLWGVN